jgi:hypothetical protein
VPIAIPMLAVVNAGPWASVNGWPKALRDPLCDGDRVLLVGDVLAQDRELVAAEAGDHLVLAQRRAEALGGRPAAACRPPGGRASR